MASTTSDDSRGARYLSKNAFKELFDTGIKEVLNTRVKEMLDAMSNELKKYFDEKLTTLLQPIRDEVTSIKSQLQAKDKEIANLQSEITSIKAANNNLLAANSVISSKLSELEKFKEDTIESFSQVVERVEDRNNRGLGQTIVVRGLPEKNKEQWNDTRNILAKYVSEAYDLEYKEAFAMFERVHRGGGNGFEDCKKGKRDIYALCTHWDDSEMLVSGSYQANKSRKD